MGDLILGTIVGIFFTIIACTLVISDNYCNVNKKQNKLVCEYKDNFYTMKKVDFE